MTSRKKWVVEILPHVPLRHSILLREWFQETHNLSVMKPTNPKRNTFTLLLFENHEKCVRDSYIVVMFDSFWQRSTLWRIIAKWCIFWRFAYGIIKSCSTKKSVARLICKTNGKIGINERDRLERWQNGWYDVSSVKMFYFNINMNFVGLYHDNSDNHVTSRVDFFGKKITKRQRKSSVKNNLQKALPW